MYLIKNGIPYDVAFSLGPAEKMAYSVVFGELEGNSFDWNTGTWRERK